MDKRRKAQVRKAYVEAAEALTGASISRDLNIDQNRLSAFAFRGHLGEPAVTKLESYLIRKGFLEARPMSKPAEPSKEEPGKSPEPALTPAINPNALTKPVDRAIAGLHNLILMAGDPGVDEESKIALLRTSLRYILEKVLPAEAPPR